MVVVRGKKKLKKKFRLILGKVGILGWGYPRCYPRFVAQHRLVALLGLGMLRCAIAWPRLVAPVVTPDVKPSLPPYP